MNDVALGSVAGFIATAPMTMAMEGLHEQLPWLQRYPLPPRQIAMNVAEKMGLKSELTENERRVATIAAHFAVGTTAGAIYGPLSRYLPGPPALSGAAFGLGVWAVNYLAMLPALDLLEPPTDQPVKRHGLMIAAHLIWGAATGMLVATMKRRARSRRSHVRLPHHTGEPKDNSWLLPYSSERR